MSMRYLPLAPPHSTNRQSPCSALPISIRRKSELIAHPFAWSRVVSDNAHTAPLGSSCFSKHLVMHHVKLSGQTQPSACAPLHKPKIRIPVAKFEAGTPCTLTYNEN